jgi:hypothetical protein
MATAQAAVRRSVEAIERQVRERSEAGLPLDGLPDLSAQGERDGFYQGQLIGETIFPHWPTPMATIAYTPDQIERHVPASPASPDAPARPPVRSWSISTLKSESPRPHATTGTPEPAAVTSR